MSTVLERMPEVILGGEADLIEPVELAAAGLLSSTGTPAASWSTFLEVPCEYGVIDVVHVVFATGELERRRRLGLAAVPERRHLLTLHALQDAGGQATVSTLAQLGRISEDRLRKVVGPELERRGWVHPAGQTWHLMAELCTPVTVLLAVEIKQFDLRRGLAQARRYAAAAQHVTLAVGPTARVDRAATTFEAAGVGLVRVVDGAVRFLCGPVAQPDIDPLSRVALSEQILHMHEHAQRSGPVREVFGRLLLSAGRDPRLAGASG